MRIFKYRSLLNRKAIIIYEESKSDYQKDS